MAKRGNSNVAGKARKIGSSWKTARETTRSEGSGDWIPVDPGMYTMQLVASELAEFSGEVKFHLHWCVIGESEFAGALCQDFPRFGDDDSNVWMQRLLIALGVDDETIDSIETDTQLAELFAELVEAYTTASVKVVEKDGYTNMRVRKLVEVEDDMLVDPAEAMKGKGKRSGGGGKAAATEPEGDGDSEEIELEVGTRVQWEAEDGETKVGVIKKFDADENPVVLEDGKKRSVTVDIEAIELEAEEGEGEGEGDDAETEGEGDGDDDGNTVEDADGNDLVVGSRVYSDEYGEAYPGTVASIAPGATAKTGVFVEYDDGDSGSCGGGTLHLIEDGTEAETESEGTEETTELEVGDRVIVTLSTGDDIAGEVKSIDGDRVKVKLDTGKLKTVDIDAIAFETDD